MKCILNLVILIPSLGWGGMMRTAADLSRAFPPGVKSTFVLFEDRVVYPFRGELRILGQDTMKRLPVKGLRLFLNVMRFRRIVKEVQPDVVLAFHHNARTIACLTRFTFAKSPFGFVSTVLGVASQYRKVPTLSRSSLHRFMESLALRESDRIVTCTQGVKSDLVETLDVVKEKIVVIGDPMDMAEIIELAQEPLESPWFPADIPVISASGRLAFEKNHEDLLKAFSQIRRERPCRLVILGDGPLRASLGSLAGELGVSDDVRFTGFQQNPFKFVARSTLFVLPSLFEALGRVLIEAMALGCPIVAYDCPVGPREVLAPDTPGPVDAGGVEEARYGLLVPPGDVTALAHAIRRFLDEPPLRERYSKRGPERAKDFDAATSAAMYLKVMQDVLIKKGPMGLLQAGG